MADERADLLSVVSPQCTPPHFLQHVWIWGIWRSAQSKAHIHSSAIIKIWVVLQSWSTLCSGLLEAWKFAFITSRCTGTKWEFLVLPLFLLFCFVFLPSLYILTAVLFSLLCRIPLKPFPWSWRAAYGSLAGMVSSWAKNFLFSLYNFTYICITL